MPTSIHVLAHILYINPNASACESDLQQSYLGGNIDVDDVDMRSLLVAVCLVCYESKISNPKAWGDGDKYYV